MPIWWTLVTWTLEITNDTFQNTKDSKTPTIHLFIVDFSLLNTGEDKNLRFVQQEK